MAWSLSASACVAPTASQAFCRRKLMVLVSVCASVPHVLHANLFSNDTCCRWAWRRELQEVCAGVVGLHRRGFDAALCGAEGYPGKRRRSLPKSNPDLRPRETRESPHKTRELFLRPFFSSFHSPLHPFHSTLTMSDIKSSPRTSSEDQFGDEALLVG